MTFSFLFIFDIYFLVGISNKNKTKKIIEPYLYFSCPRPLKPPMVWVYYSVLIYRGANLLQCIASGGNSFWLRCRWRFMARIIQNNHRNYIVHLRVNNDNGARAYLSGGRAAETSSTWMTEHVSTARGGRVLHVCCEWPTASSRNNIHGL